ncbi:MAG: FecR domain-containing protein [Bryobacteraceae bacterium]
MGRQQLQNMLPLALLGAALWSIPARAAAPAQIGTVNYVEGRVLVDGRPVTSRDLGNVTAIEGNVVATRQGKAEILLTPGVLLRLGDNSQVRMDAESLSNTRVSLLTGEAMVEADQVYPENHIVIVQGNARTAVLKKGLYEFTAVGPSARVIKGEAAVDEGGRSVRLKDGHQLILTDARMKARKFDTAAEDDLYAWSRLRSQYQAEASAQEASMLAPGGPGWYGADWYWDPWFGMYAFIPGDGFFWGPFGFPFFSPYYAGYFGYGYGYGHGWYGGRGGWHGRPGPAMSRMGGGMHMGGGFGGGMHMGGGGGRR